MTFLYYYIFLKLRQGPDRLSRFSFPGFENPAVDQDLFFQFGPDGDPIRMAAMRAFYHHFQDDGRRRSDLEFDVSGDRSVACLT